MAKHYGLKSFVPQNNNYVVFDEYFNSKKQQQQQPVSKLDAIVDVDSRRKTVSQ